MVNRKYSGFTMIEMLVVIGIIVILAGMLFLGGKAVFGKAKAKSTRVTLDNLAGMLVEFDAKTQKVPDLNAIFTTLGVNPIPAPGDVNQDAYPATTDRYQDAAILGTQGVMAVLRTMPTNKAALEKLTNEQILVKPITPPAVPLQVDADGNLNPPILADAWGNPIIYVPGEVKDASGVVISAGGLAEVTFEDHPGLDGDYNTSDDELHIITSKGVLEPGDPTPPGTRPFFASAGEDGSFIKGDDNIYSFEN